MINTSQECTSCSATTLNWTVTYSANNVSSTAWEFKFNVSDTEGNAYTTTGSNYVNSNSSFYIEKDNVRIDYFAGNNSNSTIEVPAQLILAVYDLDNQSYVSAPTASVSFNITKLGCV